MKKIFTLIAFSFFLCDITFAQLITEEEFDKAEEKYLPDVKLKDRSKWLFDQGWFSKDGLPMYNIVIPIDTNLTTDQVYVSAYQTIVSSFYDANVVTKLNDREAGSFIVEGFCWTYGSIKAFGETLTCLQLRFDIKKGKVRCICIPQYNKLNKMRYYHIVSSTNPIFEKPYTEGYKNAVGSSRVNAKIYLRTYIWTKIIMDRLEKHITEGASGIENDDW